MTKHRFSIRWLCESCSCTTPSICVHEMRVSPMFKTVTTGLSIAPLPISHFRWGWDSNPWVPLMLHYILPPHRQNLPMLSLRPKKPPDSLSRFNTSANKSMRFCRNPMLSTSSAMINTRYCTSFRLETKFGYIWKMSVLHGHIGSSSHFVMGLTLSWRLWVAMILSSILHPSLAYTQCSMLTSFGHISHHYWTPKRLQN